MLCYPFRYEIKSYYTIFPAGFHYFFKGGNWNYEIRHPKAAKASVSVDEQVVGSIRHGYLVLIGVCDTDTEAEADRLVRKMLNLRIFSDENGKTNLSLKDVNGELC